MKSYDTQEMQWPELDEWERELLGEKKICKIKKEKHELSLKDINMKLKKNAKKEKEDFDKWKIKIKQKIRKEK